MVEIPYRSLSDDALEGLIDAFIWREGTDYGAQEASLESKRKQIRWQLEKGKAKIVFEVESETFTLLPAQE